MSAPSIDEYLSAKIDKREMAIRSYNTLNGISSFKRGQPFDVGQKIVDVNMGYNDIYIAYVKDKDYFSGSKQTNGSKPRGGATIYYL